jgi:photosystem II stability/assembly factor-like uncharacterized protein
MRTLATALAAAATLAAAANDPLSDADRLKAAVGGLTLRAIGPAMAGGRIADIEVHPRDRSTWYVAVGSGGVWKTTNAGTTWTPVFDDQPSFSIGEITLDPRNPEVVWVGTGENVSGRHVAWGDGVYRSRDGGRTWARMGLARSEHIGRILVDPRNSNVILVAAEGPLWAGGGERGVYRSADGGATWTRVLHIDDDTGATDLEFDPSNPDVVYAAAYRRRRHVWGFLAGGPKSGIHKSADGGLTWRQVTTGLPKDHMGKIGLAVTAADPNVVYATIEAKADERGFYQSTDKGESWEKRNPYISGGTGPHYYQEIEASPTNAGLVYQVDVFLHVTRDAGRTFTMLETGRDKHSDNHAIWIDPDNGRHLIVGTDAGLYETWDEGTTFRHFPNLPIAQFYKVALSARTPFYDVLAGAQDLGTLHGPSRTFNREGIRNHDWYTPLGADGYGVAFDPRDPDLLYLMWQEGQLYRRDRRSEEAISIRPQPAEGDPPERWNWDAPLLVSAHDPHRLYYASQRLWRSSDRGDTWTPVSGDLTRGLNRYEQPFLGRVWSVDALHDTGAMSKYSTIASIAESPLDGNVLIVGTDDGLVQVSADGGQSWTRTAAMPGAPARAFINDVEASLFDARTIYVVADAHKDGDFAPYAFVSADLGRTWRSIAGDLPKGTIVWAIEQDHVDPDLLFIGAETGLYFSSNGGKNWLELAGGVPTISFRDVQLHRRETDLVGASFGRGIYILDDYTPLRGLGQAVGQEARLFPVRDAWWYVPYTPGQAAGDPGMGSDHFTAPNPPPGALLTFYLREAPTTEKERRQAAEKPLAEAGKDVAVPGFDTLRAEAAEQAPKVLIRIADAKGSPVRILDVPAKAGLHRVNWDLRGPAPDPIDLRPAGFRPPWDAPPIGPLVAPGRYSAALVIVSAAGVRSLGAPQTFEVEAVPTAPEGTDFAAAIAFQQQTAELSRRVGGASAEVARVRDRLRHMRAALVQTPRADPALFSRLDAADRSVADLGLRLSGDTARQRLSEPASPAIAARVRQVISGHWDTRMNPTTTQRRDLEIASTALTTLLRDLAALIDGDIARLEEALEKAGAPWTPGRRLPQP